MSFLYWLVDAVSRFNFSVRYGCTSSLYGQASLYNHFASKQDLYEAVLARGVLPLFELMQSLPQRENPSDIDALIAAVMDHLSKRPRIPRLIQHEVSSGGDFLVRIARLWIHPLVSEGITDMKRDPGKPWEDDELPQLICAWIYLFFGHFTLAPLFREVLDVDPLSAEGTQRHTRLLQKLARLLFIARTAPMPSAVKAH